MKGALKFVFFSTLGIILILILGFIFFPRHIFEEWSFPVVVLGVGLTFVSVLAYFKKSNRLK